MSDVYFKVKLDGQTYELDRLTLGEARILKHEFDMQSLELLDPSDPDHLIGLLYLAMRRKRPHDPRETLMAQIEGVSFEDMAEVESDGDPTEADEAKASGGSSGKTRKNSGSRG
jgi:hypothetical protein